MYFREEKVADTPVTFLLASLFLLVSYVNEFSEWLLITKGLSGCSQGS
jgi:hypothetical protein